MLRLFRNYLCLVTVLQLGTAVQAQQNSVTSKPNAKPARVTTPAKPSQAAASSAAKVRSTGVVIPSKAVQSASAPAKGEVSPAKTELSKRSAKTEPAQSAPKSAKTEPAQGSLKSVKTEPTQGAPKSVKTEPAQSAPKSVKTEPTQGSSKSVKTEPTQSAPKAAKTEPAQSALKSVKTEAAQSAPKSEKIKEKVVQAKHSSSPRLGLVPPPPPDTPTIFAGDVMFPGIGADYNNPAALAARRKDIASQLASAKKLLADKEQRTKELKDKVVQFQSLFSEGVISRRELETSQKESDSTSAELNDAKTQTIALQNTLSRLDDRLKPKALASSSKKKVKGKIKAALNPTVKVAGSSTNPTHKTSTVVSVKEAPKDSGSPVLHSSENMDSELSSTSPKSSAQADLKH